MIKILLLLVVVVLLVNQKVYINWMFNLFSENKKETKDIKISTIAVLYDEAEGHVIQKEENNQISYLKRHEYYDTRAGEYKRRSKQWRLRSLYPDVEPYDEDHYRKLLMTYGKTAYINCAYSFKSLGNDDNWTTNLSNAARYKDKELKSIEASIKEYNELQYSKMTLNQLYTLNLIHESDETKDLVFDTISKKL